MVKLGGAGDKLGDVWMAVSLWEVAYISAEVKVPLTPKN